MKRKRTSTKALHRGMTLLWCLAMFLVGIAVSSHPAEAQPFAYVTNFLSNDVSVIDTATNTVVATVLVGPEGFLPFGVAITPDGAFAYVTNFGSNNVSVIDTATNTVVATVPVGFSPFGVAITPDGAFAYVTNTGSDNVSVIDTATNTVVATVPVGFSPFGVAITPGGAFAYVANTGSDKVSVIATATNTVVATVTVPLGSFPQGVAITPGGAFVYVANTGSDKVSVIDTGTNTVVATVLVGVFPQGVAITRPQKMLVIIDIKPGSFPNSISPKSKGVIPVAILTTSTFDAATVDSTTVLFGATGTETPPVQSALEDVDGDGDDDMILHFNTRDTGIVCGGTSASLTGKSLGGQMIEGSDSVKTVACK